MLNNVDLTFFFLVYLRHTAYRCHWSSFLFLYWIILHYWDIARFFFRGNGKDTDNQSVKVDQSIGQSVIGQSVNRSIDRSINQSINQSVRIASLQKTHTFLYHYFFSKIGRLSTCPILPRACTYAATSYNTDSQKTSIILHVCTFFSRIRREILEIARYVVMLMVYCHGS